MTAHRRTRDGRFLTGQGRYVGDLCDEDTLHCWFVRSPVAHGLVTSIDTDEARGLDGVVGVFTGADLDLAPIPGNTGRGPRAAHMERPPLARDRVRYTGEPVAVVVAHSRPIAEDAAGLVWIEVDELPVLTSIDASMHNETLLFPEAGSNVVDRTVLAPAAAAPTSDNDVAVTVTSISQRLAPMSIEPPAILARPSDTGMTVWCGHQAPHRLRRQLAGLLDLDPSSLRVIAPDVGGAFGMKGMLFPEYLVVARLASVLEAPVAWLATRRENVLGGTHGRSQRHEVTLRGSAQGDISEIEVDIVCDVGAYPHNGSQLPFFSRLTALGLYDIPRAEITTTSVVTNLAPVGSYRGAGRPEAALAIERAVDAFARKAGLDPIEVRLRNVVTDFPHQSPTGALYDSGDYRRAIETAVELLDLPAIRDEQRRRQLTDADPLGVGVGAFIERAGGAVDSGEYARVEIDSGARQVVVRTGSTDQGQGHDTVWTDLIEDVFEVADIAVVAGDTGAVADGVGTFGSRSAQVGASAAVRTARRVLAEARRRAADRLEASEHDMVYASGVFSVAGVPSSGIDIFELARDEELTDEELFVPGAQTFPYGVHAAVVEVAVETGVVRVLRIVAVDDCGNVLNDTIVDGQLHGSLLQGLGQARFEAVRYDGAGQLLTSSLMDYLLPTATDAPPVRSARLCSPAPSNPLGVKGTGEAGCIGLPPAVLNATLDALAPLGVTDLQLPLDQATVWEAIQRAKAGLP